LPRAEAETKKGQQPEDCWPPLNSRESELLFHFDRRSKVAIQQPQPEATGAAEPHPLQPAPPLPAADPHPLETGTSTV
jgi:hypothetical protein